MKKILGLDIGTNSIGWALIQNDFDSKEGKILAAGCRVIPMEGKILSDFGRGNAVSNTAKRTMSRGTRRLYQRKNLRRERLLRVLNVLEYLPKHFSESIDFAKRKGQYKPGSEVKLSHVKDIQSGIYKFIFRDSFEEMISLFKENGYNDSIPSDWTIYYLRVKALTQKVTKEELSWILLNFNQKRGYYQSRDEDLGKTTEGKEFHQLLVDRLEKTGKQFKGNDLFRVVFTNGWVYNKPIVKTSNWKNQSKEFIVSSKVLKDGSIKRSFKEVDSEADWAAIKAKKEDDLQKSNKTVGQYIFDELLNNPNQKIRGQYLQTIGREFYKDELYKILSHQANYYPELKEAGGNVFNKCCKELYPKNISHRNNIAKRDLIFLLVEDILFYQRPLKSKKSTIGGCQFETRKHKILLEKTGKFEQVSKKIKVASRSNPLFQEYRLWQFVSNLKIYIKEDTINGKIAYDVDVTKRVLPTDKEIVDLFDFLNAKKEIDETQLLNYLSKQGSIDKKEKTNKEWNYFWNYVEEKKYPCSDTRYQILTRLKKLNSIKAEDFLCDKELFSLWQIIYSVKNPLEYKKALAKYANKKGIDEAEFLEQFIKHPPYATDYCSLSTKAIKKLLPLMRRGKYWSEDNISIEIKDRLNAIMTAEEHNDIPDRVREKFVEYNDIEQFQGLPVWLANYVVYGRHSESGDITKWTSPNDIQKYLDAFKQHSLRNPIVESVILETLKIVKDIWLKYGSGKLDFFDEIHVELAREIKNSAEKRKKMTSRNTENENTNYRIREILKELQNEDSTGSIRAYSPSQQEILKLYEEGVFQNPNTNFHALSEDEVVKIRRNRNPSRNEIQRYKLWLEQGYISPYTGAVIPLSKLFGTGYEIEHIIPQSRYYNNSLSNKVICETSINKDKGNFTGYEYIKERGGNLIGGIKLFNLYEYEAHCKSYFSKNLNKRNNLLCDGIPDGFINRQLNDTRYITKKVLTFMSNIVRKKDEQELNSVNVLSFTGSMISDLKNSWGLNDVWNELISKRFERMNMRSESEDYRYWDDRIKAFRCDVPEELKKGFSKKRIDHRHHTLDAIVIACADRDHRLYLTSLHDNKIKNSLRSKIYYKDKKGGHFTRNYLHPWNGFSKEVLITLSRTVVSFKQNKRVINKANNKTWQWRKDDSKNGFSKKLIKQSKGDNWAVRKQLHIETVYGKIERLSSNKKLVTSNRVDLASIKNMKQFNKIVDEGTKKILLKHLENYVASIGGYNFEEAFNESGVNHLNNNIKHYNNNKDHKPIYKVKQSETGSKFSLGQSGNNSKKYVEAAKGTNLYFAVYHDDSKNDRVYETVPFYKVLEYQKQIAYGGSADYDKAPTDISKGELLFFLSPNDLVFVPTDEEIDMPSIVDFANLTENQINRIYVVVSFTDSELLLRPFCISKVISPNEFNSNNKDQRVLSKISEDILDDSGKQVMIKTRCWKLTLDRLGNVKNIER